jgi:hypothetical protein
MTTSPGTLRIKEYRGKQEILGEMHYANAANGGGIK